MKFGTRVPYNNFCLADVRFVLKKPVQRQSYFTDGRKRIYTRAFYVYWWICLKMCTGDPRNAVEKTVNFVEIGAVTSIRY